MNGNNLFGRSNKCAQPQTIGQPLLASTPSEEIGDFVGAKFAAHITLLIAIRTFRSGRRCQSSPHWCYIYNLCTVIKITLKNVDNWAISV